MIIMVCILQRDWWMQLLRFKTKFEQTFLGIAVVYLSTSTDSLKSDGQFYVLRPLEAFYHHSLMPEIKIFPKSLKLLSLLKNRNHSISSAFTK